MGRVMRQYSIPAANEIGMAYRPPKAGRAWEA
jgi:hypothetical protein